MADIKFETVFTQLNTSTGTQDVTLSGFGTVKAAIVVVGEASSLDTTTTHQRLCVGYTDGTNYRCYGAHSRDGVATSNTFRTQQNRIIQMFDPASNLGDVAVDTATFITDGIRLNILNAPSTALYMHVTLIGGADVANAAVGNKALLSGTSDSVTGLGFKPNFIDIGGMGFLTHTGSANHSIHHRGFVWDNGTTIEQSGVGVASVDNVSTYVVSQYFDSNGISGQTFNDVQGWTTVVTSMDADGFTMTHDADPFDDHVHFLALELTNSPDVKVFTYDTPSSTGSSANTQPGFEPSYLSFIHSDLTTTDSIGTSGTDGWGYTVMDGTTQASLAFSDKDGAGAATVAKSRAKSGGLVALADGSTVTHEATFTSFDASGFTLNYTTATVARKWIGLAIGPGGAAPSTSIPVIMNSYRQRRCF